MTHEEICTYEVCKLAKEKGFDWKCLNYYNRDEKLMVVKLFVIEYTNSQCDEGYITAPTQSLLQRWLREEKGCYVYPFFYNVQLKWGWVCREKKGDKWIPLGGYDFHLFDTYELALEYALKYALENLV